MVVVVLLRFLLLLLGELGEELGAIQRKRFEQRGLIIAAAADEHFGAVFGHSRAVTSSWGYFNELFIVFVGDFRGDFYPLVRARIETVHVRIAQDVPGCAAEYEKETAASSRDVRSSRRRWCARNV